MRLTLTRTLALSASLVVLFASSSPAQTTRRREGPVPADAASVESIVAAFHATMSHAPAAPPDFDRMRQIFLYVGMLIPPKSSGGSDFAIGDVDQFEERYGKAAAAQKEKGEARGLVEHEIARRTDCFGNVCQVFSTYESRYTANDARPFERGIVSLQLVRDGRRWWIASAAWDLERPDNPISTQYSPAAKP